MLLVPSTVYLGVILDSELSWGPHIIASVNLKLQEIAIKSVLRLKHHGTWNNHYIFGKGDKSNSHAFSIELETR